MKKSLYCITVKANKLYILTTKIKHKQLLGYKCVGFVVKISDNDYRQVMVKEKRLNKKSI